MISEDSTQKESSVQFELGDCFGNYENSVKCPGRNVLDRRLSVASYCVPNSHSLNNHGNTVVVLLLLQFCYSGGAQLKSGDQLKAADFIQM